MLFVRQAQDLFSSLCMLPIAPDVSSQVRHACFYMKSATFKIDLKGLAPDADTTLFQCSWTQHDLLQCVYRVVAVSPFESFFFGYFVLGFTF